MEIQKWEYKRYIKKFDWDAAVSSQDELSAIEQELNSLGDEGWELITVVRGSTPKENQTFYFKRPLQSPTTEFAFTSEPIGLQPTRY